MSISSKPTSGQLNVSQVENHRYDPKESPSDRFRLARHPPRTVSSPQAIGGSIEVGDADTCPTRSWCRTVNGGRAVVLYINSSTKARVTSAAIRGSA